MNIDALIHARWIIPIEPAGAVLEQHALAIHDGRILEILDSDLAATKYSATSVTHMDSHALLPGLINAHGHAAMTLMRGLADDLPMMTWLHEHVWPTEQKWIGADFVYDGSLLACAEMLRGGITCFNDMYFFPEETVRAVEQAGMRATVGLIVVDFPSAWARDADDYLNKGIELHDQLHNNTLITTAFAPHAPYSVSDAPLQRIAMLAEELDIPIHMHVHETADEVKQAITKHGRRPLQRLDDLGLLSPRLLAVHMTQLDKNEIQRCAETGVHVIHCPESNLKLASGYCPVHELNQAGVNVALGTDGAASNNDLNMFSEMRTAALLGKGIAADATAIPAEHALHMATINAARSLGLDEDIGSLLPGKAADFIAIQLDDIETTPVYNPVSQLVYATGRDKVTDVWVAGKHLLKDRILTTLDTEEIVTRVQVWRSRIAHS